MASHMIPGGWSGWTEADKEVKEICEKVKHEAEAKENAKFPVYTPLNYRRQTVAGTNYEIKVYVGNDSCLFLKAFRGIGPKPEISIKSTVMLSMPSINTH
ncbi:cystatin-B-like [Clarias gariepinus]|uniref:cystatin-B-like n=1 Tax=Clarias gariepinus TaxID=13013 RepID=UPI00234C9FA4|nr:cystatin-B-like [Clarias gariepinus]